MYDLEIHLDDQPGSLSLMGRTLGDAGISIEGGGAWVVDGKGIAHFLFNDGLAARSALEAAGIRVAACREVLAQRLKQDIPGQLGILTGLMADAGVNIEVLYSDHDHQADSCHRQIRGRQNGLRDVDAGLLTALSTKKSHWMDRAPALFLLRMQFSFPQPSEDNRSHNQHVNQRADHSAQDRSSERLHELSAGARGP